MLELSQALKNVAVIGAAGKMGSGIALLLLQEMATLELNACGGVGGGGYRLVLIDNSSRGLDDLRPYLKAQLRRYGERSINWLREAFSERQDLISNGEVLNAFVDGAMAIIHCDHDVSAAKASHLIFEAVPEVIALKTKILKTLADICPQDSYVFSNTSSIPIHELGELSGLGGRMIGFHFYNPPAVQKLLEIISSDATTPDLIALSEELATRLRKVVVHSNDVAGFIGNGHFIREIAYACQRAEQLASTLDGGISEAIYIINTITQDYMLRPMGIFQLIDYVGLDVCASVARIMTERSESSYTQRLIDGMLSEGIIGGHDAAGKQRPGFFEYDRGTPTAIYSSDSKGYQKLEDLPWIATLQQRLGPHPDERKSWRSLSKDPKAMYKIKLYFRNFKIRETLGTQLAADFMTKSEEFAKELVSLGVAANLDDVGTVLEQGFYHLYGPSMGFAVNTASSPA